MPFIKPSTATTPTTPYTSNTQVPSTWFDYVDASFPNLFNIAGANTVTGNTTFNGSLMTIGGSTTFTNSVVFGSATSVNINAFTFLTFGSTPATVGNMRFSNNSPVYARNSGNTADARMFDFDNTNTLAIGDSSFATTINGSAISLNAPVTVNAATTFNTTATFFGSINCGSAVATSGTINLSSSQAIKSRNSTNTSDIWLIGTNPQDAVFVGNNVNATNIGGSQIAINGPVKYLLKSVNNNYTVNSSGPDHEIAVDTTSLSITVTLPAASSPTAGELYISNIAATGHGVSINAAGSDIISFNGVANTTLTAKIVSGSYQAFRLVSNGVSAWVAYGLSYTP